MQTIAKIKLAAGNVGWYEPLSRIHLTLTNPIAEIKAGTKLDGIRQSLAYGTVILIEGSLNENEILESAAAQAENEAPQAATFKVLEEELPQEPQEALAEKEADEVAPEKPKKASKKKT